MIEEQLLTLLQCVREDGDDAARTQLNELLRNDPEARAMMSKMLVDEQALISHLRDESIVSILDPEREGTAVPPISQADMRLFAWPRQLAAALIAGALVGLLGVGVVWAVGSPRPRSQARLIPVANGDFEDSAESIEIGFPTSFGGWSGDPAEVIVEPDGNRMLRFVETANVTGDPNGGAVACNVFQIIDLSSLQQQWDTENSEAQMTLELSGKFRREAAANDAELPRLRGGLAIHLYRAEPDSIGKAWPLVIRDAIAVRKKTIKLEPGEETATISASCILAPEATIALISLSAHTRIPTKTPIPLGGYFVDDVKLTATKQPTLPVNFVQ
jgi:hypothetical protein